MGVGARGRGRGKDDGGEGGVLRVLATLAVNIDHASSRIRAVAGVRMGKNRNPERSHLLPLVRL